MQYTKKQRDQYNHDRELTCAKLGITKAQYNWFRRIGNELHKIYLDNCNGTIEHDENAEDGYWIAYKALTKPLEGRAKAKAESLGLYIYFQTDPRGATIYLDTKPIADNAYNRASVIY